MPRESQGGLIDTGATDDDCFGAGLVRADGRKLHATHLFAVKTPPECREPGDVHRLVARLPPEMAFRPLAEGGCPLP